MIDATRNPIVGCVLREVREDAGLSAQDACDAGGLSGANLIMAYERGERTLSVERLYELAALYKVDPLVLMSVIERRCQAAELDWDAS